MASLAVLWKESIRVKLKRSGPHFRVTMKSNDCSNNSGAFGSSITICKNQCNLFNNSFKKHSRELNQLQLAVIIEQIKSQTLFQVNRPRGKLVR